jgi:hypothetical protein
MLRQRQEQAFHHAGLDPVLETPVRRLVRTVSRWQVLPGCAARKMSSRFPLKFA